MVDLGIGAMYRSYDSWLVCAGAGVFGVEMFMMEDGILLNEVAPRPHNSGHYTIEACASSQYEQVRTLAWLGIEVLQFQFSVPEMDSGLEMASVRT